jgi:ArsR family transcriptional regulator, arsenate/arsenite/antimonite-responsive transcriptional repressor
VKSLPLIQCCTPLTEPAMSDAEAKQLETVFKALADRHRLKIVNRLLAAGDAAVCVCDFEAMLDLKQPTVSYHLKQLLDAGIVQRERRGSFAYFSIADGAMARIGGLLDHPAEPLAASQAAATA